MNNTMWWLVFLLLPGAGAFCEVPNVTDTFEVHRLVERAQMMQGKWHILDALENYDWWYSSLWEGVGFPAADDPSPHLERLSGVESAYDAFTLTRARFPTQEAGNVHCARTCDDLCTGDCFVRGTALVPIRYYGLDFAAPPRAGDASYRLLLGPTVYTVQVRWNFTAPGAAVELAPRVWSLDLPYTGGVRLLFNAVTGAGTLYAAPRAFRNYLVGQALADVHLFRGGTCGDDASATCPGSMTTYNVPCAGRGRCESTCECVCDKAPQEMLQEALVVGASAPNTPDGTLTVQDSPARTPYRGAGCELTCPGYDGFSMASVCSGRGTCSDRGVCICDYGYIGDNCQFKCPGFDEQNAEESAQRICSKRGSCQVTDIAASSFRSADVRNRDRFFRALREFYGRCHTFIADNQVTDATKFPGEACASDDECASLHCASGACEGAEPVHSFVELALDVGTLANGTFRAAQATPSLHPRRACGRLDDCVAYDAGGIYRGAQLRVRAGSAVRAFRDPFASAVRTVDGDSLAHLMKGRASDLDYCLVPSQQRAEQPWVYRPMVRDFVQIYDEAVAPQQWEGLLTRTAPTSVADDDPPRLVATRDCEVHPDFTLRCPSCMCFRSRVQGFFDGPNCDACERGYATATCKTKCPGFDGKNIETACSGLGLCNMGIGGTGECLCGGSGGARSTADTGRELTVYRDVDASYGGGTAAYCAVWRTQDLCDKEMGCLWASRCVPRRSGGDRAVLAPPLPPFEATYYVGRYREFSTFLWPTASTDTIIDLVNWDNGTTTNEADEAQCVDFPGVNCDPDASHVFFYAGTTQPAGAKTTKQLCPKDSVDLDVLRTVAAYETPYHAWSDVFKACCRCGGGQRAHGLPTSALKVASSYESDCEDTWKRDCDSFPHCRDGRVDTAAPIDWISFRDRLGVTPDVGCCRCGGGASTARPAPCEVPSFARSDDRRCVGATPAGERCDGSYGSATVFEAPYRAYEAAVCDDPLTHVLPYNKTFTLEEGVYECTNYAANYTYRVFSGVAGLQECRDHCAANESCTAFTRDGTACYTFLGCDLVAGGAGQTWTLGPATPVTPTLFSEAFDGALGDAVISVATATAEACDGHHVSSLYCAEYARAQSLSYALTASGRPNGCSYDAEGVYYRAPEWTPFAIRYGQFCNVYGGASQVTDYTGTSDSACRSMCLGDDTCVFYAVGSGVNVNKCAIYTQACSDWKDSFGGSHWTETFTYFVKRPEPSSAPVTPSTSLCRSVLPETFATLEAAQAACESSGRCRGVSKQQSTYHLRTGSLLVPATPVPFVAVDRHPVGSVAADLGCVNDVATLEDAVDMCAADLTCAFFWRYSRFDSAAGRTCFKQSMAPYELDTRSNAAWNTINTGETYIYDMPEQSWLYLGVRDVRDCRDACDALETCGEYYEADGACILADGACLAAVGSMAHYKQNHATTQACGAAFPECLAYEGPRGLGVCNGSRTEAQCEEECALDLGCAGYEWDGSVCRLTRVLTEDATAAPGTYCARKENHARCAGWGCADVGGVNCSACTNPGARAGCCSCGGGEASNAPEVEFSVRPNPVSTRGSYPVSVSQVERRTASRINFPFEFAGVTTIRTRRRASSSTCPDCPDSDCSRCPNDCRLCVGDFTGFNCADGCGTCVLGGTCVNEPTDGVSLCDCPSASSGPRQNCCPRGTLLLQNDQYINSPNQVSGITAAVALFGSFSYQTDPRSRMFFLSNATAEHALVSGCYPCPGLAESADLCMHALCEDDLVSVPDRCRTAEEFRVGFANLWLTPPRRSFERVGGRGCNLLYRVSVFRTYREARLACVGTCAGIMESLTEAVYYTCSSVEDIHLVYSSNFNLWREVPLGVCPDATYADTAEMRHWKSIYAASSGFASNVCGGHLDQCMLDFNPSAASVFRDKASCGACFTKDAVYPTLAHGDDCSVCGYGQFGVALDPTRDTYDTVCESCPAGRGVPGTVGVIQDYATYQNSTCSGARIVLDSVVEVVEQLDADVVILGPGETACPAGSATLFEHECQVYGTLVSGNGYAGGRGSFPKDLLGCFLSTHGDGTRSVLFNTAPSSNLGTIDNDRLLCLKLHNGTCSAARQKYDERSCERFARAWGYHYAVRFGSSGGCKLDAPRGLVTYHLAAGSAPTAMTTYRNGNGLVYRSDALYMLRPGETPFTFPSNDAIGNMSATSGDGTSGDTSSASQYGPNALYLGCQYCPDGASQWHPQGLVATFTNHQLYYNSGDGNWISWPTTRTGVKAVVRPDGRKLLLLTTSNQLLINQFAGDVLVELSGRFTYNSNFDSWETVATDVHDMDMSAGRPVYWDSNQNQQGGGPKQRIVIRNGAGDVLRANHQFGAGTFTSLAAPVPMHRVAISSNARHIWATEATGELWHYDTGERIVYATASLQQVGAASGWQQVHLGVAVDRITAREDDELVVLTTSGGIYVYTVNGTLESVVSSDYVRLPASLVPPDYLNKTITNGIQISSTLTTGAAYLSRAAKDRSNEHVAYAFTDAGLPDVAPPDAWLSSRSTLAYVHDPHATYDYTHVQAMRHCTQQGLTLCTREALERWSDQTSTNVCLTGWFVDTSVPSWYAPAGTATVPGCGAEGWNYWRPESGLASPHCCRVELNDPVSEHFMSGGNFYLSCPPSADLLLAPRGSCNNTVALFYTAACDTLGGVEVAGTCEMDLCAAGTYGFGGCDDGPEVTLALAELDCPGVYADGVCTARVCERGAYRASTRCLSARQFDLGGVQFCDGHDSFARYCGADDPQPVCGDFHGSMDRCGAEHVSKARCERHANELGYTFRTAQADNFALLAYALPMGCSVVHEQSLVVYRDIYGKMPTVNAIPYMDGESVRYGKVDGGDVNALDGSTWAVATGRFDSSVTDHTVTYSTSDGDLNAYNFGHFDSVPPFTYVLAQPMEFGANYWETTSSINIGPGIIGMGGGGSAVTSYPTLTIYDPRAFVWPLRAAASVCTTPISPVRPRRFHVPRATATGATPAEGYWLDQQNMCSARGLRLCRRDEMCPVLEQVAVDFDNWFAIDCEDGSTNCWTNNGNVWPGCVTHREAAGAKPEWTGAVSWLWHGFCCEDLNIGPVDGEYECTRDADCKCYTSDGYLYTGAEAIRDAVATTAHAKVGDHLAPGYKCAPAAEDWTCVGGSFLLVRQAATCADWGSHYVVSSSAVPATTYDECLAACYNEVLCDGFFWDGTSCYLSDGLCELGDGTQDYYARSVIPPVYYLAAEGKACDALGTYGVAEEPATTLKTCENLCAATPLCREFFWNGRTCHMANGGCTEVGGEFHHYRRAEYELTAPLRVVGSQVECQSQDGANCLWGACPNPGAAAPLTHPSFAPALDDTGAVRTGASWPDRAYRLLNGPLACEGPAAGCRTDFADGTCEARPQTLIVESLNDAARVNSSVSGGPCGACPAGRFNDGTSTVCQTCGRGKYQNEVGTRACKSCPYGWYTAKDTGPEGHDSFDDCTPCPDGHFMDTPRFSDENNCQACPVGFGNDISTRWYCRACPAGYFSFTQDLSWTAPTVAIDGSTCRTCPPGRVQPLNSRSDCNLCLTSQYQDEFGQLNCKVCASGLTPSEDRTACQACLPGRFGVSGALECAACAPGTYTSEEGFSACKSCSPGQFVATVGATGCDLCAVGQSQHAAGQAACDSCAAGRFASAEGQTACDACPQGRSQPAGGQAACLACAAGRFQASTGATSCDSCTSGSLDDGVLGTYQDQEGQASCKSCPASLPFSVAPFTSSSNCQTCGAGQYVSGTSCLACPAGQYQDQQGQAGCKACPSNLWTGSTGAQSELECGCTQHQRFTGSTCEACPGNYRTADGYHRVTAPCQPTGTNVNVKLRHKRGDCSGGTGWIGYTTPANVVLGSVNKCHCGGSNDCNDRVVAIEDVEQPFGKRAKFTFYGDSNCQSDQKSSMTIGCDANGLMNQWWWIWLTESGSGSQSQPSYDGGSGQLSLSCMKIELQNC